MAVVTGGASGIGRAMAARIAAKGRAIVIVDVRPGEAEAAAAADPGSHGSRPGRRRRGGGAGHGRPVEADLGPVGVYCSNAGVLGGGQLGDDEAWN